MSDPRFLISLLESAPELAEPLLEGLADAGLESARRARLRERVLARASAQPEKPSLASILRADEGRWVALLPNVFLKPLRVDRVAGTQTSLWRLDPGAHIPAHTHTAEEECLVLDGDISWEGVQYGRGDFLLARAGLHHTAFTTQGGALLMIRSELTPFLDALFAA